MIFCEAFLPSARKFFWKPQRFPIADAHYAMGFAFLSRALEQTEILRTSSPFSRSAERNPVSRIRALLLGISLQLGNQARHHVASDTPLITTVPYVYEAFREVYQIDRRSKMARDHAFDRPTRCRGLSRSSRPRRTLLAAPTTLALNDSSGVINASAYRAFLLTRPQSNFSDESYRKIADRNLNFVLAGPKCGWLVALLHG